MRQKDWSCSFHFVINDFWICTRQFIVAFAKDDSEVHNALPVVTAVIVDYRFGDGLTVD